MGFGVIGFGNRKFSKVIVVYIIYNEVLNLWVRLW